MACATSERSLRLPVFALRFSVNGSGGRRHDTMDDALQAFLAASPPRVLSAADLAGIPELFPTNLSPTAAAWLAPFSPLLPASSAAASSARTIPAGAVTGMASAVALDQVTRTMQTPVGDQAATDGVGGIGPPMGISSSMHVPISVDGQFVLGLSINDVVLDTVHLVDAVHPLMRAVYDSNENAAWMMGASGDGSAVMASTIHVEEDGALTIMGSMVKRPTVAGGCATLLMRSSSRIVGEAPHANGAVHTSPKDAYMSFVFRMLGQFGCASLPQMGGGGNDVSVGTPSPSVPPPLMTSTIVSELSSLSVVARLASMVLDRGAVHPLGLRIGLTDGGNGSLPVTGAPSGRRAPLLAVAGGADRAAGIQLTIHGQGVPPARPAGPRTRTKVCLDEVVDEAERARIVRNRASAARSNAKRRAQREAAARGT